MNRQRAAEIARDAWDLDDNEVATRWNERPGVLTAAASAAASPGAAAALAAAPAAGGGGSVRRFHATWLMPRAAGPCSVLTRLP